MSMKRTLLVAKILKEKTDIKNGFILFNLE